MSTDGLILSVCKPVGWTSFDVVAKLRGTLRWRSVGHAGTLDPPADGVLIILCGSATRRTEEFMQLPKEYRARIRFGVSTLTDDMTGDMTAQREITDWSEDRIRDALNGFSGEIEQVPPAVSAIKIGGRRSYDLSRAGKTVTLAPRRVSIYRIELLTVEAPEIGLCIQCSRGTYIRSIARDLGARLGWGGALSALTRTAIGRYRVENSLSIADVIGRSSEFAPL